MRILFVFTLILLSTAPTASTRAQDYKTLLDIPEGSTLINLSATERVEVEQDLLTATLQFKHESKDPKVVQNEINTVMKKAVDKAKKISTVKVKTQRYYVHEYDRNRSKDRTRTDMVWRGSQSLTIKGQEADDLLKLAGELQELGLTMNGLNYSVSPDLLEETRNSLLEAALAKLSVKAERTAKAIKKSDVDFLKIDVDLGQPYRPQISRSLAFHADVAEKSVAAPVAAPGESNITLTVSAQALISD